MIADFVRRRTGKILVSTVDTTSDFAKVQVDPEIGAALEAMFTPPIDDRSPGEVFRTIAARGRRSDVDIALLASRTPAQLEKIIVEMEGDDLRKLVRLAVSIISAPGDELAVLPENLGQALKAISARSPLGKRPPRARDYIPMLEDEIGGATVPSVP